MKAASTTSPQAVVALAIGLMTASGLVAVAFSGWLEHGGAIFMSLVESGMAWCF